MTHVEAFETAIKLSLIAPDYKLSNKATEIAKEIEIHLTAEQVEQAMMKYEMETAQ